MKTHIIRIGNSHGLRIPKPILDEIGLAAEGEVELKVRNNALIISRSAKPRAGWAAAFREMARHGDDRLLVEEILPTKWEHEEWQW